MSWAIVAAVLFGALLHASWNALIKSGQDQQLDTALIHVLGEPVDFCRPFGCPRCQSRRTRQPDLDPRPLPYGAFD